MGFSCKKALGVSNKVNLDMIGDSIHYSSKRMDEIIFDAEHFFDGYKSNPKYSLKSNTDSLSCWSQIYSIV